MGSPSHGPKLCAAEPGAGSEAGPAAVLQEAVADRLWFKTPPRRMVEFQERSVDASQEVWAPRWGARIGRMYLHHPLLYPANCTKPGGVLVLFSSRVPRDLWHNRSVNLNVAGRVHNIKLGFDMCPSLASPEGLAILPRVPQDPHDWASGSRAGT